MLSPFGIPTSHLQKQIIQADAAALEFMTPLNGGLRGLRSCLKLGLLIGHRSPERHPNSPDSLCVSATLARAGL